MPEILEILIESISIPEVRASSKLTEEQEEFFKRTAEKYGILQPIIVNDLGDGNYRLLAGKRRLQELQEQGKEKTQAVVVDLEGLDETMVHLAENLARGKTDPASVSNLVRKAHEEGASVKEIADATGHTPQWVKIYLMASELPDEYKQDLKDDRLKIGHIKESLKLPNPMEVQAALDSSRIHGWSVEQAKNYIERRMMELEEAKMKGETEVLEEPPSEEERVRMAKFKICNSCRNHVEAEKTTMYLLCKDCVKLLNYIKSQVGPPDQAIDEIYQAISQFRSPPQPAETPPTQKPEPRLSPQQPTFQEGKPEIASPPGETGPFSGSHGLPAEETQKEESLTPEEIKLLKSILSKVSK